MSATSLSTGPLPAVPEVLRDRLDHSPVTIDEPIRVAHIARLSEVAYLRHDHGHQVPRWLFPLIHERNTYQTQQTAPDLGLRSHLVQSIGSRSNLARPYICLLIILRLTLPSTVPELWESVRPLRTAW